MTFFAAKMNDNEKPHDEAREHRKDAETGFAEHEEDGKAMRSVVLKMDMRCVSCPSHYSPVKASN